VIGHINELAELYVLGELNARQRAGVDRHVAKCERCRSRLDDARQAVASIAELEPRHELPPHLADRILSGAIAVRAQNSGRRRLAAGLAAAAMLLLFSAHVMQQNGYLSEEIARDDRAIGRMAVTAFDRAAFLTKSGTAAGAQVLYSPDGAWYFVVIMHPTSHMQLAYALHGKLEKLGDLRVRGDCGTLYVSANRKLRELVILDDGKVMAEANLAYR
jgi:hypothetical protein